MDKQLVDYFIEQTNDRFKILEGKVDKLIAFKWQIIGGSVVISAMVGIVVQLLINKLGR
jgi:hypothetical protein